MQTAAFLPIWLRPWASPTVVVVLPSPSGVGVIAVTTTYLPRGRSASSRRDRLERDLGLGRAVQLELVVARGRGRARRRRSGAASRIGRSRGRTGSSSISSGQDRARGGVAASGASGACRSAARIRWVSRMALVSGPTPPGTGVMADATSTADAKSTSPTMLAVDDVDPDVDDDGAGLEHRPGDEAGPTGSHDDDVGARDVAREVASSASGRR